MVKFTETMARCFKNSVLRQMMNSSFSSLSSSTNSSSAKSSRHDFVGHHEPSVVTGEIIIPKRCFHSHPSIKVSLQDNFQIDCLQEAATIACCSLYPSFICPDDTFHFALSYSLPENSLTSLEHNKWYTISVRIEDVDGNLLCYNHRVSRAIDDQGHPMQLL